MDPTSKETPQPPNAEFSLGKGLEQVRSFLSALPPQGISIHGTTLERAEDIRARGFLPAEIKPAGKDQQVSRGTYVYNLKPISTGANVRDVIKSIQQAINDARGWGSTRSKDVGQHDGKPGLVVLVPPDEPTPSIWHTGKTTENVAYPGYVPYAVNQAWVLGIIPLPEDPRMTQIGQVGELANRKQALDIIREIVLLVRDNKDKITEMIENPPPKATLQKPVGTQRFVRKLLQSVNPFAKKREIVEPH